MVALRSQAQQPGQRRPSLIESMIGQQWPIANRQATLKNIVIVFRDDLVIYPAQCQEATAHLVLLRRAVQQAQAFYKALSPQAMAQVQPRGTIEKLNELESQATEVLLLLVLMETAEPYSRVQLHLLLRQLLPQMFQSFEDATSQLAALLTKVQEVQG